MQAALQNSGSGHKGGLVGLEHIDTAHLSQGASGQKMTTNNQPSVKVRMLPGQTHTSYTQ